MNNYDNNNKAAIWGNDKREKDTHPHFKGKATIDNVEYYVSAWKRDDDANPNAPALKLSFTKVSDIKDQTVSNIKNEAVPPAPAMGDIDDDIPFIDPYKFTSLTV